MASASYVWIDHEVRDSSEAKIPFVNAGLHYGAAVAKA